MDSVVYAIMLWIMPSGVVTGAFEEIPEGWTACEEYIELIVTEAADVGTSLIGKCTDDVTELARLALEEAPQ